MIQSLSDAATHLAALLFYPGLFATLAFGGVVEIAWTRLVVGQREWPPLPRRRPTLAVVTVALCAMLAAVQLAAPLNPLGDEERSVVLAAAALIFTTGRSSR